VLIGAIVEESGFCRQQCNVWSAHISNRRTNKGTVTTWRSRHGANTGRLIKPMPRALSSPPKTSRTTLYRSIALMPAVIHAA